MPKGRHFSKVRQNLQKAQTMQNKVEITVDESCLTVQNMSGTAYGYQREEQECKALACNITAMSVHH